LLQIYIDADACPVKDQVYRVAARYGLRVTLVSNSPMRIPDDGRIELVLVKEGLDAADDWIAERVEPGDIVITGDVPLAWRCIGKGAGVIGTTGHLFTEDNVGEALATRDLLSELRGAGAIIGGPPPFQPRDSSRFLQALDQLIQQIRRKVVE
jgi:uncharacterized protein